MIAKSNRWQKTIMATAAAAFFGLYGLNAAALSLGRITVQSGLGEPLRAEIEIPDMNAEEAASLKVGVAPPDAFRAAGLDYNPAMASLQATLQRRPDGRAYLRLSSDRAVNEPFVDMILEARWATGRIVRDYTLLFDPPSLRQAAPTAPTSTQVPAQPAAPSVGSRAATPARAATLTGARPAEPLHGTPRTPVRTGAGKPPGQEGKSSFTVKSGDTASKIAAAVKPANVSLDQMLVALLRANPEAFVHDNVNRIKAGAIMTVPTEEQAQATPVAEATQIIVAQSKDFNEFRRQLAGNAPSAQVAAAERTVSGKVETQVKDKKPATTAPNKLTLSKGAVQGKSAEDQLAKSRGTQEAATRAAEITKNISDLGKLGATSGVVAAAQPAAASSPAKAAAVPGPAALSVPAQAVTPVPASSAPAPAVVAAASKPAPAASRTASAPKPAASAAAKLPAAAVVPQAEPSMVDDLIENPLAPAGAIGLIALLAGFGFYRARQRRIAAQADSVFLESRLQPDSFFGASGGQSVDTSDNAATGSSMVYSPSQLDAVDDVDPVAEADVYLAYGRDMQAEEILKDALRTTPGRVAVHQKLLEIFAKRHDTKSFEATATLVFRISNGQGSDWEHICELGQGIDPDNALYQPGGQPNNPDGTPSRPVPLDSGTVPVSYADPLATEALAPQVGGSTDLDLDLDFSLDEKPVSAIRETRASSAQSAPENQAQESGSAPLDLDFGLDTEATASFETPQATVRTEPVNFSLPELDIASHSRTEPPTDSEDFKQQAAASFGATTPIPLSAEATTPVPHDSGMLEFDLGSLSLDLGDEPKTDDAFMPSEQEDPLVTKLSLADEFRAIGDDDGARALIEEVIAEASGDIKIKAQRALNNL